MSQLFSRTALSRLALALPAGLVLLVLWATMSTGATPASSGPAAFGAAAVLLVFVATFGALALNVIDRLTAVVGGAFLTLLLGILLGFYFPPDAFRYLGGKLDTLALLGGLSIVTGVLAESGLFERLAYRAVRAARGSARQLMLLLCVLTFVCSLFINNLATILVVIPMSLRLAKAMDIDPVPLVIGEIISSNLGGAATMVGDFPNMLIATETGLPFEQFLVHLAPICCLQLGVLLLFIYPRFTSRPMPTRQRNALLERLQSAKWEPAIANRGLALLAFVIVGLIAGGWLGVPITVIAIEGAVFSFLFGKVAWKRLIRSLSAGDMLFFACLFVMVGAVDATGLVRLLGPGIQSLWQHNPAVGAIALAWAAALLTCFLNAGPTTALLMHVLAIDLAGVDNTNAVWWALSLGVCAGSSATLTGATAGPVAAGLLEARGERLTFLQFARTGVPIMLLFLIVSSAYLALLLG